MSADLEPMLDHAQAAVETLASLNEPYATLDLDGRVLAVNRAALRLLGGDRTPTSLAQLLPEDQSLDEVLRRWRGTTTPRPARLSTLDGQPLIAEGGRLPRADVIVVRLRRRGTTGIFGLAGQVQEANLRRRRQELERSLAELREANQRLLALDTELREHTRAVAHDVRTPLFTILGSARYLRSGDHVDADGRRYLDLALEASDHLHEVTESLLDVARVDRHLWAPVPVDPTHLVEEAIGSLRDEIERIDASTLVEPLPGAYVDPWALRRVVRELVSNSIAYRSEARPLEVRVHGRRVDRWVEIRVDDNGRGLPPGPPERLFELFQGGTRDHLAAGRGIGLATCRRLVTRWGGTIRCEPSTGTGASFQFTVPYIRISAEPQ